MSNNKMSKSDFIAAVASKMNATKKSVSDTLEAMESVVIDNLKQKVSTNVGYASVESKFKQARQGRNPQTGKTIEIPAKNAVTVKPSKALKEAANS